MDARQNTMQESFDELGEALEELRYQIYLVYCKPVFDWIDGMLRKYDR